MEHNVAAVVIQQRHEPHEATVTEHEPALQATPTAAEGSSISAPIAAAANHQPQEPTKNESTSQNTPIEGAPIPEPYTPAKPSVLVNVANVLDPAISNNPVLSAAIQVLDQISEVGKVLPFVAPAFILLKIIIDLEKRATEVDVKCSDLVERIIFMLSHIPLLEHIDQTPSIVKIVDRMNEAMKDSTALIAAYRKQGRVARRLRLSNRDKFTTCVDAINKCSSDLLISLQIHQTVQLNILTRPIPSDAEDVAAESFISAHGGSVDAVVHNRELVGEFARQQHLVVDDVVVEQPSIAESIQQNHAYLDRILHDNINSSIVDGLRNVARDMLLLEAERKFICVQCEKEFTSRTNGPHACSFHSADSYHSKENLYNCCNNSFPCQSGTHRIKHHCDYPYGNFFPRVRSFLESGDTRDIWTSLMDTNLETDSQVEASVGQLFCWSRDGARVAENTLYVNIGAVWYRERYYFDTFTTANLQDVNDAIRSSGNTLIFRTSLDESQYAMGEWVLSDSGRITGIKISAKAATSTHPYVQLCPIDIGKCLKDGEVVTISKGGLLSYTPNSPYVLPKPVHVGPALKAEPSRSVRTDFKAVVPPKSGIILKTMSDPPLIANPDYSDCVSDYFRGTVCVFNNNASGSLKSMSIMSASAIYRLIGDAEYAPATKLQLLGSTDNLLPVTIDPKQSWTIKFEATIPRTEDDVKLELSSGRGRALLARYRPLRIKLVLEDVESEKYTLVLEYVFQPLLWTFKKPGPHDIDILFFDNYITFNRRSFPVTAPSRNDQVIKIPGTTATPMLLEKIVYRALQENVTELSLGVGKNFSAEWEWSTWALVDLSCKRVYAFKIILYDGNPLLEKHFGAVYYVPCPPYGEPSAEVRPIEYAKETAGLPPLKPYTVPVYPQDDDFDDSKQASPPSLDPFPSRNPASTMEGLGFESTLAELNTNLASINTHLSRLTLALEKLAGN